MLVLVVAVAAAVDCLDHGLCCWWSLLSSESHGDVRGRSGEVGEPEWPQSGGDACLEDVEGLCWAGVRARAT